MKVSTTFSKTLRWPLIASSNTASLYYVNVIGLYVNVHSEITILVLLLTACNSETA